MAKKRKRKSVKKAQKPENKLPPKINVGGKWYNTPTQLKGLRGINGGALSAEFKLLVYSIKKSTGSRLTFKQISNKLFKVRDDYAIHNKRPEKDTFEFTLLKALKFDDGFYPRGEVLNKIVTVHTVNGVQRFRFNCFQCRRVKYLGYNYTMASCEDELNLFWQARDKYIEEVDDSSIVFNIYFAYEKYTNFALVDFNNIQLDNADEDAFKEILNRLILENDYE